MVDQAAVLYHEPDILTILIQASFLLALNVVDHLLDKAIYCGLIGQILIGMAYGTPAADILGLNFQQAVTSLGYLGLLLIVYEGGLATDIKALRANLLLSVVIAMTGILAPIALSFILLKLSNASILQAFAAGCALSSTSLGTTFTVLKSSGLDNSKLGTALTSAAILDDIIGLVLVQVISNLGSSGAQIKAPMVVRPIFVSLAYALAIPVILFIIRKTRTLTFSPIRPNHKAVSVLKSSSGALVLSTLLLLLAISTAAFAGTSVLFAAYLAGLLLSSISEITTVSQPSTNDAQPVENRPEPADGTDRSPVGSHDGWEMISPPNSGHNPVQQSGTQQATTPRSQNNTSDAPNQVLNTLNSAEVPRSESEEGAGTASSVAIERRDELDHMPYHEQQDQHLSSATILAFETFYNTAVNQILKPFFFASIGFSVPISQLFEGEIVWRGIIYTLLMSFGKLACGVWLVRFSKTTAPTDSSSKSKAKVWQSLNCYRAQSIYPAAILGSAMVARGEIGFLISAIAQANGIFDGSNLYLIVTWAILLCTILGPISVGLLTRRINRLRGQPEVAAKVKNSLGQWLDS